MIVKCQHHFSAQKFDMFQKLLLSENPLLQLLAHILEDVCSELCLADVAKLSSCCKHLRPLLQNAEGVYYILQHMRPINSKKTKQTFLLSRSTHLLKVGRAQYSQSNAFALAMLKHKDLTKLRHVAQLKKISQQKKAASLLLQVERASMLKNALIALDLPTCLAYTSREGIHFRRYCIQCPDTMLDILLSTCVEGICFRWFLMHHTDYRTRLDEHIAVFGFYEGASGIVASTYERPDVWPWLQHIFTTA
jgi:hypothetical protein